MSYQKMLGLLLTACIAAGMFSPRAAKALAPGTLSSHHAQYYYSNSRAPCTTRGYGAVRGACAGTTVISYRPVAASTTYTPRYVPLFDGFWAPWSRPVAAPLAPAWGACPPAAWPARPPTYQPACPTAPQPECCDTLQMVPWGAGDCATSHCATGDCGAGLTFQSGVPHEVTRIVVPDSPVQMPAEFKSRSIPTKAEKDQPAGEKKPADANPASAPRLTNPRDRLTMLPIRRISAVTTTPVKRDWRAASAGR